MTMAAEGEDERKAVLLRDVDYDITKAVLSSITTTSEAILLSEFGKITRDDRFMLASRNGFMSYVSALAILSFSLKEESKENVAKLMEAIGLEFDDKVFGLIPKAYTHNHLVYVYAFYFLVINGRETSEANIRIVVDAMGTEFDSKAFEESLGFICSNTKCGQIRR